MAGQPLALAGLTAIGCYDEAYQLSKNVNMVAGWLTRIA